MGTRARSGSALFFVAILAASEGCFVLFPLDEYNAGAPIAPEGGADGSSIGDGGRLGDSAVDDTEGGLGQPPGRIMFVSSMTFTGNLGGLSGADAKCADAAKAAGLTGTFRAFLSVDGAPAGKRFTDAIEDGQAPLPIVDLTGRTIAATYARLIADTPAIPINHTERRTTVTPTFANDAAAPCGTSGDDVWMGTDTNGTASGKDCSGWTSEADTQAADVGVPFATSPAWVKGCSEACNRAARLYCAQP